MAACDLLFLGTQDDPNAAAYNDYADTCAGRQPPGTQTLCTDAFPG
jgi:hypothetical protein